MENLTKKGLLLLIVGIAVGIVANILLFFVGGNLTGVITLIIAAGIGGLGGFLMLIAILLMVIGRKEFGEKHSKSAIYAFILYAISIMVSVVITMISSMMQFFSNTQNMIIVTFAQTLLIAVISSIAYIFLLKELENSTGKIVLYAAFIVMVITTSAMTIMNISIYQDKFISGVFEGMSLTNILSSVSEMTKTGIYSVIGTLLLLFAVIIPYKRISSGELASVPLPQGMRFGDNQQTQSIRRCPNCGRVIPFDAVICPYCAKRFEEYSLT